MARDDGIKPAKSVADEHYERTFSNKNLKSQEEAAAKGSADESADIKSREAKAGHWKTSTTTRQKDSHRRGIKSKLRLKLRHKSAYGFIVVLLVGGLWYSAIFAPNLILVNIKDLFTNDLADATTALSKYSLKMIDHKLGNADCSDEESIKCKLSTMSRNQVLAFKQHGFEVDGEKIKEDNLDDNDPSNDEPESRWKVNSVKFPDDGGTASDGESFAKIASSSDNMRQIANGVWNPRSSFFMDVRFKQRIKDQFDLTKNATVFGRTEKEVDKSFDESMQGKDETIDRGGQGAFSLKTLASQKGQDGLKKMSEDIANMPNSYTNVQCGFYTQGKVVYNATKKAKEVTLARFAMQYLKAADQIKAGLSDEITANVLSGKLAWSRDGGFNGANATDASMYRHIVLRESLKKSENGMKYYADAFDAIGALQSASLPIMLTAKATQGISGAPGGLAAPPADLGDGAVKYCLHGQTTQSKSNLKPDKCPALTMAAGAAPAFAGLMGQLGSIAAMSDRICPPPPKGVWLMYPTAHATSLAVMPTVANLFNSAVSDWAEKIARDFTSDTKGVAASDAVFAGTGIILGDMAMSRGMMPATKSSLKQYLAEKAELDKEYEQIARYEARNTPFDIYNQYSFMGSLVRSVNVSSAKAGTTLLDAFNTVARLVPLSIAATTPKASAIYNLQPAEFDEGRLQCSDAEYKHIGIEADMACNVRYSMSKQELDASVKDTLDYMLEAHPDETKDKIQELQERAGKTDFERDAADVNRQLSEAREASNKPFIDEKTGEATKNSEYEKFLTYCVNRKDPWGRSGLDVRREELSEDEKEERRKSKDADGNQILSTGKGSEYERKQTASYMSVTEGAKADQDWYTGKKCLEDSEMLRNFRAYTMMCSVDGSFAGSLDCTEKDKAGAYTDDFYTSNDILYLSWN